MKSVAGWSGPWPSETCGAPERAGASRNLWRPDRAGAIRRSLLAGDPAWPALRGGLVAGSGSKHAFHSIPAQGRASRLLR